MTVSERIMLLIEGSEYKPIDISRLTGIDKSSFTRWKQKDYKPSIDSIVALAQFFEVSTDWILTGEGDMTKKTPVKTDKANYETFIITGEEDELLQNFRRLDREEQVEELTRVKTIVEYKDKLQQRSSEKSKKGKTQSDEEAATSEAYVS